MLKATRTRAEERFIATQKKGKKILKEKEIEDLARAEHTAALKALRLARDASDKEAAEAAAAEKDRIRNAKAARR